MPAVRHCSRIDAFELKIQMERRLGSQKAQKYFNLLTIYLSLNLRKSDFDKICVGLIGGENVRLHNELLKAIVKNATVSETPPRKQVKGDGQLASKIANGAHPISDLRSVFPQSPKKGRTLNLRERKFKDYPSPLGLHEKTRILQDLATTKVLEQQSATELFSLGSHPPVEVNSVEEGEEVEQDAISPGIHSRSTVRAPFGVSIHSKETRKVLCSSSAFAYATNTCHYCGHLPPTSSLANRLRQKLKIDGLDISMDCVNLLNNGLDSFLKRVIKPSLELASSRSLKKPDGSFSSSISDLHVTTETNPKILGDDWPIRLAKVFLSDFQQPSGIQMVNSLCGHIVGNTKGSG